MTAPISLFNTVSTTDAGAPVQAGVAVSGTTTYYSQEFSGANSSGAGLHIYWTGTPTGTLTFWMSDLPWADETNDNDWVLDTGFVPTNPAGAAGKFRDDFSNARAYRKRLKYVNASGTGTLFGYASVPQVG
jgi:hypothetical protein